MELSSEFFTCVSVERETRADEHESDSLRPWFAQWHALAPSCDGYAAVLVACSWGVECAGDKPPEIGDTRTPAQMGYQGEQNK